MGRRPGLTVEDTRAALLRAAATVFARSGYEGASIAEITAEAGLSSGPIYLHFGGKAELFAAMLQAHTDDELDAVLGGVDRDDVASLLAALGADLARKQEQGGSLVIEAVVAARRDPKAARLLSERFGRRERHLAELLQLHEESGDLDSGASPATIARFCMVVALGSLLVGTLDLPAPDRDEWSELIAGVVGILTTP